MLQLGWGSRAGHRVGRVNQCPETPGSARPFLPCAQIVNRGTEGGCVACGDRLWGEGKGHTCRKGLGADGHAPHLD